MKDNWAERFSHLKEEDFAEELGTRKKPANKGMSDEEWHLINLFRYNKRCKKDILDIWNSIWEE